jgi:cardiolipin synthase
MFFNIYGVVFYYMFRNARNAKRIIRKIDRECANTKKYHTQDQSILGQLQDSNSRLYGMARLLNSSNYVAFDNTSVKYYPLGQLMFEDMLQDIRIARKYIFLEYFIVRSGVMWDEILEILKIKASQGVDVRLIVDGFGSMQLFGWEYRTNLHKLGISVHVFSPLRPIIATLKNNRDHRKMLIVDGVVCYTGGVNIGDEYINHSRRFGIWKDTGVRLHGEAVWGFCLMFLQMWNTFCKGDTCLDYAWYRQDCETSLRELGTVSTDTDCPDKVPVVQQGKVQQVVEDCLQDTAIAQDESLTTTREVVMPYGVSPFGDDRLGENIYIEILNQSRQYVYIYTPYLILSEKMIHALRLAAKKGVDVRIVLPGIPDKKLIYRLSRSYYGYLLSYGIKIYEYTPGFVHGKVLLSDDEIATVGSVNLDYRSLYLHFECGAILCNKDCISAIKRDMEDTIYSSREVLKIRRRKFSFGILDTILHLLAPLM